MLRLVAGFVGCLLIAQSCFAQSALEIEGPEGRVGFGEIAELKTNVDLKLDDQGRPSHSILWRVEDPRELRAKVKLYENGTILAIPTGCKPVRVFVSVQVIDWESRRVESRDFSFDVGEVRDDPGDPDPDDPGDEDPVGGDPGAGAFRSTLKESFAKVPSAVRDTYSAAVAKNVRDTVADLKAGKFAGADAREKLSAMSRALFDRNVQTYGNGQALKDFSGFWETVQTGLNEVFAQDANADFAGLLLVVAEVLEGK